jgi:hypothetical protein
MKRVMSVICSLLLTGAAVAQTSTPLAFDVASTNAGSPLK